jgi:Trk-type K+ transport systems, membrane components
MIQIGGLGLITLTLFFLSFVMDLGLGTQFMAGHILELETWRQIRRILFLIFFVTIGSEFIGALLLFTVFQNHYPLHQAWFISFFHAISSFCSAGITIFDGGLTQFKDSYVVLFTTIGLMFIGELGFITWQELGRAIKARYLKKPYRFSLHSKIVLYGSLALLITTAIMFWIIEHNNILHNTTFFQSIIDSFFYAISFRSTGFLLTPLGSFQLATLMLIMIIAFIGSAPGSTGGGIKITTFTLFLATIRSAISGKDVVTIKGRSIALTQVFRSVGIVAAGIGWIVLVTFCLLITEKGFTFIEIFFETTSAFTSLGMGSGVAARLSIIGKLFIIISMIVGRIGSLTLILALKYRKRTEIEFSYPEEKVMLG